MVALLLAALMAAGDAGFPQARNPLRMMSVPVSPSVVATVATSEGRLVVLVLWRGAPQWHSSGSRRSESSGVRQGTIAVTYHYGDTQLDFSFDPAASTATVQGKRVPIPANTNVLFVDGVDSPGRGGLTKTLSIDPARVDLDPRLGLPAFVPLLRRSEEIVDFLQCDAVPFDARSVEPCQELKKR